MKERTAAPKRKGLTQARVPEDNVPANNGPQTVTKGAVPWKPGLSNLLPQFETLSGRVSHSPVSAAWSTAGLYFHMSIRGKKTLPRFLVARGGFSDGLRVWIDTRCSPGIHRGTRFCHCFHFFPGQPGGASGVTDRGGPFGILEDVPRAREFPASIDPKDIQVHSEFQPDGYSLWAHVPAKCLTGYSPLEFDRIRLYYDVVDTELGTQSMTLGPELRYAEDPSHWVQASLVGSIARSLR